MREKVERRYVAIQSLIAHPSNYKNHPQEQINDLKSSLIRFGQIKPAVVQSCAGNDEYMLVAGHGITMAAKQLLEDDATRYAHFNEWDVVVIPSSWNEGDIKGYMVADNETGGKATDDEESLAKLLQEQLDNGYDLASVGSDEETLRQMLDSMGDVYLGDDTSVDSEEGQEDISLGTDEPRIYSDDVIRSEAFKYFRNTGFPYRFMPVYMCMQELNKLANADEESWLQSRLGYHIADTYHPHRMHAAAESMKSPFEAFQDDNLLNRAMRVNQEHGRGIPLEISHLLYVVSGTQACSNFRPGFALHLYRSYCKPGSVVLDTSTGYGGRLVGFMASRLAGKYIGIDPNVETYQANTRMSSDLFFAENVELYNLPAEDVSHEIVANRCDFAFTSPPYFAKEHYSEDDTQSWKRYNTGDAWRVGFLQKMLALQYVALKPGSYAIVNIADVKLRNKTYPLVQWTIEDGKSVGFDYLETKQFSLQHRFGSGQEDEVSTEPVIVFRKPLETSV